MKGFFKILVLTLALCFSAPQLQAVKTSSGCGDCWQNGLKEVTPYLFGGAYILCNCETKYGKPGAECTCNPE